MSNNIRALLIITGLTALAVPSRVLAQTDNRIETVTVTAEKTSEDIQNVGANVTALSTDDLRESRVYNATDLATQIPNFNVKTDVPGGQQIITVRGVGLDDFSSSNSSSVGVYVDDVYLALFAETDFTLFDMARVEVLKGPQGTLYGRNSTAGAINLISARPDFDGLSGSFSAGYGNYETFEAEGAINIPISSSLALRFAIQTTQQDQGFWFSRTLDRDLGRQDVFHERAQALWQPTNSLTLLFKLEGEESNSEIGVGKFFGTISTNSTQCPDFKNPAHCVDAWGYTDMTANPFTGDWNHVTPNRVYQYNATLHIDDDFGWATLTSVSGYIHFQRDDYVDADASPLPVSEFDENDHVDQFSEEIRLAGTTNRVEWLTGTYYSWDKLHNYTPGTLAVLTGDDVSYHSNQTTHSAALFGQAKWPLSEQLTLITGLRASYEDRAYIGGSYFFVCCTTPLFSQPVFNTFENDKIFDRNISWHTGLNWTPSGDTLVYASASESTKSGGFYNGISFSSGALAPYRPEHLTDYELGLKSSLLDSTLRIDGSAFYYDYGNYQSQVSTDVGTLILIKLSNIRSAEIYGLDLGLTWLPVDGLSLRLGLGLLHSRLGTFMDQASIPPGTPPAVYTIPAGNKMPDAPDQSLNALARYESTIFGNYTGAIQLGATYSSKSFSEALNLPYEVSPESWVFDSRASIATSDSSWEIAFWVKNVFDERHAIQTFDDGDSIGWRMFNNPRTFGVTLGHKFG